MPGYHSEDGNGVLFILRQEIPNFLSDYLTYLKKRHQVEKANINMCAYVLSSYHMCEECRKLADEFSNNIKEALSLTWEYDLTEIAEKAKAIPTSIEFRAIVDTTKKEGDYSFHAAISSFENTENKRSYTLKRSTTSQHTGPRYKPYISRNTKLDSFITPIATLDPKIVTKKKRESFPNMGEWKTSTGRNPHISYKGKHITIFESKFHPGNFSASIKLEGSKEKPEYVPGYYRTIREAKLAVFDHLENYVR